MRQLYIIVFFALSTRVFSQTFTVDSFYPVQAQRPDNYESLFHSSGGWTCVAEYYFDNKSIKTKFLHDPGKTTFYTKDNTPYKGVYFTVKGDKVIMHLDRRGSAKIIYIDEHTLILEQKTYRFEKIKEKKTRWGSTDEAMYKTKARTIYKR